MKISARSIFARTKKSDAGKMEQVAYQHYDNNNGNEKCYFEDYLREFGNIYYSQAEKEIASLKSQLDKETTRLKSELCEANERVKELEDCLKHLKHCSNNILTSGSGEIAETDYCNLDEAVIEARKALEGK